jgi:hypothetical protein
MGASLRSGLAECEMGMCRRAGNGYMWRTTVPTVAVTLAPGCVGAEISARSLGRSGHQGRGA